MCALVCPRLLCMILGFVWSIQRVGMTLVPEGHTKGQNDPVKGRDSKMFKLCLLVGCDDETYFLVLIKSFLLLFL